jgi:hypothetical protein
MWVLVLGSISSGKQQKLVSCLIFPFLFLFNYYIYTRDYLKFATFFGCLFFCLRISFKLLRCWLDL